MAGQKKTPVVRVSTHPKGWQVKKDGNQRADSVHPTKEKAVKEARQTARKVDGELTVHNQDGQISQRDSHGPDPEKSKG